MIKKMLFVGLIITGLFACSNEPTTDTSTTPDTEETSTTTDQPNQFGDAITETGSITYDELLAKLAQNDSLNTKVVGTVKDVCQAKGCWMTIVSDQSETEMRVKFKDYAFFVPKDISGQKVIFEGIAYKEETSIDELRHYAEDAGKTKAEIEAITEPEEDYKFMASGVLLVK